MAKEGIKYLATAAFRISLLFPPLTFYQLINDTFRIVIFAIILISLFSIQLSRAYLKNKMPKIASLWLFLPLYISASLYVNGQQGFRSALGYSMILLFALSIFSIINSQSYKEFTDHFLKLYTGLFFIIPVFCIINVFINVFIPSLNIFSAYFSDKDYQYLGSPFGLVLVKPIMGITIYRSFFFFIEPVYLSLFYLINVFVIKNHVKRFNRSFTMLNIVGGIVTFSYLFFVGYIILKIFKLPNLKKVVSLIVFGLIIFVFQDAILTNFMDSSSSDDRLFRIQGALGFLEKADITKILFGLGFLYDIGLDRGISAGLLSTVIENGILGLAFLLFVIILFAQKNLTIIIVIFLGLFTIEPFKLPLFWIAIILAGQLSQKRYNLA
jgi:hypothetical protein